MLRCKIQDQESTGEGLKWDLGQDQDGIEIWDWDGSRVGWKDRIILALRQDWDSMGIGS